MQAEVGRDAVEMPLVALRVEGRLREGRLHVGGGDVVDRLHERRVLADVVGRRQHGVELLRPGRRVGEHLVEEAVTAEIDQAALRVVLLADGGVVLVDHLAERRLGGPARPGEDGEVGERGGGAQG